MRPSWPRRSARRSCSRPATAPRSTCSAGDPDAARRELEERSGLGLEGVLARWDDGEAVSHLFRVAAGLDSLVPGESQILGQVRDAYESARTRGATGALLNRLFEDALRAGKRVRTEAKLHELPESVAASAVELGVRELGGAEGKRALLFGAGKMSELAARNLRERGAEVVIASRTLESAQDLAERVGGSAAAFDAVAVELPEADLVISATRCPYPILHAEAVRPREKPLVLVDVAVPRDLDPGDRRARGLHAVRHRRSGRRAGRPRGGRARGRGDRGRGGRALRRVAPLPRRGRGDPRPAHAAPRRSAPRSWPAPARGSPTSPTASARPSRR